VYLLGEATSVGLLELIYFLGLVRCKGLDWRWLAQYRHFTRWLAACPTVFRPSGTF